MSLHALSRLIHAPSSLAPFRPPTSTRHVHCPPPSSPPSQTKCPYLLFVLNVRCTTSSPMTYSYTMRLSSIGSRAKNRLCCCRCCRACVRASTPTSDFDLELTDLNGLRGRVVAWPGVDDLREKRFRDLGFEDEGSEEGISLGAQCMPGSRPRSRSLGFILVTTRTMAIGADEENSCP